MPKKKQKPTNSIHPIEDLDVKTRKWVRLALKAKKRAYAPYSKYNVGAIVIDSKGNVHSGCNVENASYPNGICAERTAISKMVSRGARQLNTVVVAASSDGPAFPCGMCLQVIREFGKNVRVVSVNDRGSTYQEVTLKELLPFAFSSESLNG